MFFTRLSKIPVFKELVKIDKITAKNTEAIVINVLLRLRHKFFQAIFNINMSTHICDPLQGEQIIIDRTIEED